MSKERAECQHLDYADTLDGGVCNDCGATLGGGNEEAAKYQHLPSVGAFIAPESGHVYPETDKGYPVLSQGTPVEDCCDEWYSTLDSRDTEIVYGVLDGF